MLQPHERRAVGFLLRHLLYGTVGGFVFGGALLWLDFADLRTLIGNSDNPLLYGFMLFFGLFVTFGSVGMGAGVMALGGDDD
jgi:hypothetical protein